MKSNENGRSMIEMLGVLVIIGVLSVGGIYGYTTAMRKHRVNEILHTASMLFTLANSANGGDGDCIALSATTLPKNFGGVNIDIVANTTVEGVKPTIDFQIDSTDYDSICKLIENNIPTSAEYRLNNCGQTPVTCPS